MNNFDKFDIDKKIIFVDCFNTVVLRNKSRNCVFKNWAIDASKFLGISWKNFYKVYKKVNFWLCFRKIFSRFVLQEKFSVVLDKMYYKLLKRYRDLDKTKFLSTALNCYIKSEMESHKVCQEFVDFLKKLKNNGAKIYIVSDFYCNSSDIEKWIKNLRIDDLFAKIFSSCDYEKEKSTCGLYKKLLQELNIDKRDVVMIGDNIWSDVLMARLCGIKAFRIKFD